MYLVVGFWVVFLRMVFGSGGRSGDENCLIVVFIGSSVIFLGISYFGFSVLVFGWDGLLFWLMMVFIKRSSVFILCFLDSERIFVDSDVN